MSQFLIKFSKIVFLGLLPLFLISSIGSDRGASAEFINVDYLWMVSGNSKQQLNGKMSFKSTTENVNDGKYFNTLKLKFDGVSDQILNVVEFTISKEDKTHGISIGNYKVNPIDGFINHFDGVFGVVNINLLGERPFFSTGGNIYISRIGKSGVSGNLNMLLSNGDGRTVEISGNFKTN
ncbi:MAG: hypothetical protein WBB27_06380 [Maribacter sp.]